MDNNDPQIDFAISYAGEDSQIAGELYRHLSELGFSVFFAETKRHLLVGVDAESFFERLFTEAKEVIVLISKDYKRKEWTRYEWDVIRERANRFIPIRLDDTKILGLPTNILYLPFKVDNYDEIVDICAKRLIAFEQEKGIRRSTEYEQILNAIKNESKGALAEAYQLVKDGRKRIPLDDCKLPEGNFKPSYEVVKVEWSDFSVVRRRVVRILVPLGFTRDELHFNLKHCAAIEFNTFKPDAIMVFAYGKNPQGYDINGVYTAGRAVFAPFGKWEKARDGVAYNIPTQEFDYTIDFATGDF